LVAGGCAAGSKPGQSEARTQSLAARGGRNYGSTSSRDRRAGARRGNSIKGHSISIVGFTQVGDCHWSFTRRSAVWRPKGAFVAGSAGWYQSPRYQCPGGSRSESKGSARSKTTVGQHGDGQAVKGARDQAAGEKETQKQLNGEDEPRRCATQNHTGRSTEGGAARHRQPRRR